MSGHRVEFRISENPWAPSAVVEEINARWGHGLELIGLADQQGGVSSAAFVRWPDGHQSAVTRTKLPLERMQQTADAVELARIGGLPVARHELVVEVADGGVAVVQERLRGSHADRIDAGTIDAMVAVNDRFSGLLATRRDIPICSAFPARAAAEHPWDQTLGRYSDRTRRVLDRLQAIDAGAPYSMEGDDLIHTDYSLGNVLFGADGEITGIVDWNFGADRGDCRFALLGIRGNLVREGDGYSGRDAALARLEEVLEERIGPELLRIYSAHAAARRLHWSIEQFKHRPDRIERDLFEAEDSLGARAGGAADREPGAESERTRRQ